MGGRAPRRGAPRVGEPKGRGGGSTGLGVGVGGRGPKEVGREEGEYGAQGVVKEWWAPGREGVVGARARRGGGPKPSSPKTLIFSIPT